MNIYIHIYIETNLVGAPRACSRDAIAARSAMHGHTHLWHAPVLHLQHLIADTMRAEMMQ